LLNVHLNGDIVRCPNIAEIHKKAQEVRDKHRICKYNIHEDSCDTWQSYYITWMNVKNSGCSGRCSLAGSDDCPGHKKRTETGNQDKTFKIDNQVYRKMSSAGHFMVKDSKYKTLFITLTLPPFKYSQFNNCKNELCRKIFEKEINKSFSRFCDNLHNNYGVKHYIAVRERGEIGKRYHFHMLLSIKFTDFAVLNDAWCSAISDLCEYSDHAFQTKKNHVILRDPGSALRYCCKYFSKQRGSRSKTRLVFISTSLLSHQEADEFDKETGEVKTWKNVSNIKKSLSCSVNDLIEGRKSIYIERSSDFTTLFRITSKSEFDRFCNQYLYALFGLEDQKTDFCGVPGNFN